MGGQAFAHVSPPLSTPRMPLKVYTQVLTTTTTLLQQHFVVVKSALEAPGKDTYGDIDILVFELRPNSPLHGVTSRPQVVALMAEALGAKHFILEKGGHSTNFAVPWPRSSPAGERAEERFIQIDVKICPNYKMLEWELFHSAHGDLWNVLGSTIRKFGLTVNDTGMHLRIHEIEAKDRKKSMIFLTDEPGRILRFLDLDEEKWWKQFGTREDMFEYAAGCRMFWVKDLEDNEHAEENLEDRLIEGQEGGDGDKKKLKHNDRQRMKKRPIFRQWIEEFIPRCRAEGRFMDSSRKLTREQIRDEAFAQFDPNIKTIYESRLREWKLATHTDYVWRSALKGSVPEDIEPQFRAAAIKTLKAVVLEGEMFEGKAVPEVARNSEGFWDLASVRTWVEENWKQAGDIGWERQKQQARQGTRFKAEKKMLLGEEVAKKCVKLGSDSTRFIERG